MIKKRFSLVLFVWLFLFIFALCAPAWGADYYVSQSRGGSYVNNAGATTYAKRMSVSDHNGYSFSGDDIIYLCGTITSEVIVPSSGTSGHVITYDGDDGSHACTIDRNGGTYGFSIARDSFSRSYVTVQDLIITDAQFCIIAHGNSTGGPPHDITIKRCTIHDGPIKGISISDQTYGSPGVNNPYNIIIGGASGDGNTIYNIGTDTRGMDINTSYTHDAVISYNHCYGNYSKGIDGVHLIEGYNQIIEYNTCHGHMGNGHGENAVDIKGGSHDIIVRFNHFYNYYGPDVIIMVQTARGGPGDLDNVSDIYIYGNSVHDGSQSGIALFPKEGKDISNVHIWSNLVYDMGLWGISITYNTSGNSVSNYYAYNNTISNCGSGATSHAGFTYLSLSGTNRVIKNNIFYQNRPSEGDYVQRYASATTNQTYDYNHYYWPGHTSNAYWSGVTGAKALETHGEDSDPKLTNVGDGIENFKLLGTSPCKETGADLSGLAGSVSIAVYNSGAPVDMYYDDCLDSSSCDFSTNPPTVKTIKQDDHGTGWERGAYVYWIESGEEQEAPNGSIDTPSSNTEVVEDAEVTLAGSYTDPEGDTCTYAWVIEAETFKEWDSGTTYDAGDIVEDPDAGDSGDFYKSKAGSNLNHEPPNATYWDNAETQATPGTGVCDAAGVYSVTLTVNDGTVDDPTPAVRTITVNASGGTPATVEVWTRNTTNDYAQGDATYFDAGSGVCEASETVTNESTQFNVTKYNVSTYRGLEIVKTGGYPDGCKVRLKLKRYGSCTGKTLYLYEIPLSGDNLDLANQELIASMDVTGISSSAFVVYDFECSHNLTEGNMFVLTLSGGYDNSNYIEFRIDTDSNANLGDLKYWDNTGTYGSPVNYDAYIEIWEGSSDTGDTNYGTNANILAKNSSGTDNKKIAYLVDLSDISGETVNDAELELYLETAPSSNINVELWSCADVFTETGATDHCAVDDNNDGNCDTAWTGTHGQTTYLDEVAFTSGSTTGQYYSWQSEALKTYIGQRAGSIAYLILYSDAEDSSAISFSSDDDTDGQRPKLTIDYGSVSPTVPEIVSITCSTEDGEYNNNDSIGPFQVIFSEPVDVTGTPQLQLELGANDATVNYSSGTGTATLTFAAFTVASGSSHTSADLDANQLDLNSGSIASTDDATGVADAEPDDILDVFPTGATLGSLAYNHAIVIDTTTPTTSAVYGFNIDYCTECTMNGTYTRAGKIIKWAVKFSETSLVLYAEPGYPRIEMDSIHPVDTIYSYAMGLGDTTGTVIFGFPVTYGMRGTLNFTGSLDLGPGGKITDLSGNPIDTSMGALDLTAVATITLSVADVWPLNSSSDFANWAAFDAATYSVPGDQFVTSFTGNLDTDESGAKNNPISITGTIIGDATFDEDYWSITDLDVSGAFKITGKHVTVE